MSQCTRLWHFLHMHKLPLLNAHTYVSSRDIGLIFGLSIHLHPYLVNVSREGSGESSLLFIGLWCNKYWNCVYCPIYFILWRHLDTLCMEKICYQIQFCNIFHSINLRQKINKFLVKPLLVLLSTCMHMQIFILLKQSFHGIFTVNPYLANIFLVQKILSAFYKKNVHLLHIPICTPD